MRASRCLPVLVLIATLAGCDATIEPTPGTDRVYTLYGQLDADADTQAVRVIPIAETLDSIDPDAIDAAVTSRHEQTGETRVWRDSLVQYPDGTQGHVFFAPFSVDYEDTYRLDVDRSDGAQATVTVTVPPLSTLDSLRRDVRTGGLADYVVGVQGVPRLSGIVARYTLVGDVTPVQTVRHTDLVARVDGGWEVAIPFVSDLQRIVARSETGLVGLIAFEVGVYVSNEAWNADDAGGQFDPEVLVEPGTFSNVENGFGFFGAGYRLWRTLLPTSTDRSRAGLCMLNEAQNGCAM